MPDVDLDEIIDALQGVRKKKSEDAVAAALNRKFSLGELKEAWHDASPEEREEFRQLFGGTPATIAAEAQPEAEPKPKPKARPKPKREAEPKPTRAGRRTGNVYNWDVDDGGQVIKLDVARVYSGPDEDEEVEIPDAPEPEDDEDETEEVA